jgi:KUP system potassium uptake protein
MAEKNSKENLSGKYLTELSIAAIGVVFGDLGTSPLYSFQDSFSKTHGLSVTPDNILGVLSLIFWTLILLISLKYLIFVFRADNGGEGGAMALIALISPHGDITENKLRRWFILGGLLAAAVLFGEFLVTPAITVLSAVGGLRVASLHLFQTIVMLVTIVILLGLFAVQRFGSGGLGKIFGPILTVWFIIMAILGVVQIVQTPAVFRALNPWYAINFIIRNGMSGYLILGSVFLAATGGEALYSDIGHFGVLPIRITWFGIILPALVLNYFGQGALLLQHPQAAGNPFFHLASGWILYAVVIMATIAAIIASQGVISGTFSLFRQAVHLGFIPRMKINQTSTKEVGQVYLPTINWVMMIACIALVIGFGSSERLAKVYGVGLSFAMVMTSILFAVVTQVRWKWSLAQTIPYLCVFLTIDLAFFGANIVKIPTGGWFQWSVGIIIMMLMTTWKKGRDAVGRSLRSNAVPMKEFLSNIGFHADVEEKEIKRVEGAAIYMYSNPNGTPPALKYNIKYNKVIHENVIILIVQNTDEKPFVPSNERIETENLGEGFYRAIIHNGFAQGVNIPYLLKRAEDQEWKLDLDEVTYFLGRERILPTEKKFSRMAKWRDHLFGYMVRNEQPATKFFNLPSDRIVEIGTQLEL